MPQTPKQKPKAAEDDADESEKDSWGEDQKEREYYYDDACGYEIYDPDKEEPDIGQT